MTPDELRKLQSQYPVSASVARLNIDRADHYRDQGSQPPVVEPYPGDAAPKKVHSKKGISARYLVRITDFRVRLLDEDNLCAKFHVDALRYCRFLPTDAPGSCKIEVAQEQVEKESVRVEIQIFPPGSWSDPRLN